MNPDRAVAGQVVLFSACARDRCAFLRHQVVAPRAWARHRDHRM